MPVPLFITTEAAMIAKQLSPNAFQMMMRNAARRQLADDTREASLEVVSATLVKWRGPERIRQINDELHRRMVASGDHLRRKIVENLTKNIVQETRIRTVRLKRSKPGQYPFYETGQLAEGIGSVVHVYNKTNMELNVYSTAPYSRVLEEDFDRPFMVRTLMNEIPELEKIFEAKLELVP